MISPVPNIHIELTVKNNRGIEYSADAILDTGAPHSEFSDDFLYFTGFIDTINTEVSVRSGLETQKYDSIELPELIICSHNLKGHKVFVSTFEESWGIDALIGLDFFRLFKVEINYSTGELITACL